MTETKEQLMSRKSRKAPHHDPWLVQWKENVPLPFKVMTHKCPMSLFLPSLWLDLVTWPYLTAGNMGNAVLGPAALGGSAANARKEAGMGGGVSAAEGVLALRHIEFRVPMGRYLQPRREISGEWWTEGS